MTSMADAMVGNLASAGRRRSRSSLGVVTVRRDEAGKCGRSAPTGRGRKKNKPADDGYECCESEPGPPTPAELGTKYQLQGSQVDPPWAKCCWPRGAGQGGVLVSRPGASTYGQRRTLAALGKRGTGNPGPCLAGDRYRERVRSLPEFLLVALIVTLTPRPATATIVRVAARDGRRAALSAIFGNSIGVLLWGGLSAVGVASLVTASEVAYTVLRLGGAVVLIVLGARSLLAHREAEEAPVRAVRRVSGWRSGLATSVTNPKLAVFFIALFPQFLRPHANPLLYALAMAATIVAFDLVWYSTLAWAVDGAAPALLAPRVQRMMERFTGAVLIGLGVRLAAEAR